MSRIESIVKIIKNGGIGVIPTDTIYGLVGSAFSRRAVEQIYKVRRRDMKKPFIILISSINDLEKFGIKPEPRILNLLKKIWPGPVSIILPVANKKLSYLHRGTNSLAFRLPKDKQLKTLLKKTGPLVAPSANISGLPPARTIAEAKKYFKGKADFYIDKGRKISEPSVLIELKR